LIKRNKFKVIVISLFFSLQNMKQILLLFAISFIECVYCQDDDESSDTSSGLGFGYILIIILCIAIALLLCFFICRRMMGYQERVTGEWFSTRSEWKQAVLNVGIYPGHGTFSSRVSEVIP